MTGRSSVPTSLEAIAVCDAEASVPEEPGAVIPHARIRAGGGRATALPTATADAIKSFNGKPRKLMMNTNYIMTKSVPSSEELQFLEDRLYEFNSAQTGQDDGQLFAIFIRNDQQEIVAGLSGWTWANACEIRALWVHPAWRGQGHGRGLLESAEQEARARGCKVILIGSYSFQAPAFYQRCGYELEWQLNDFPPGHQHCYLVKRFAETEFG